MPQIPRAGRRERQPASGKAGDADDRRRELLEPAGNIVTLAGCGAPVTILPTAPDRCRGPERRSCRDPRRFRAQRRTVSFRSTRFGPGSWEFRCRSAAPVVRFSGDGFLTQACCSAVSWPRPRCTTKTIVANVPAGATGPGHCRVAGQFPILRSSRSSVVVVPRADTDTNRFRRPFRATPVAKVDPIRLPTSATVGKRYTVWGSRTSTGVQNHQTGTTSGNYTFSPPKSGSWGQYEPAAAQAIRPGLPDRRNRATERAA